MSIKIPNFTHASHLSVAVQPAEDGLSTMVSLSQHAGGLHLMHAMRPDQARHMAAALMRAMRPQPMRSSAMPRDLLTYCYPRTLEEAFGNEAAPVELRSVDLREPEPPPAAPDWQDALVLWACAIATVLALLVLALPDDIVDRLAWGIAQVMQPDWRK